MRGRAAELGVSVSYWDWQGHEVTVPDETLRAIVTALESAAAAGGGPGRGGLPGRGRRPGRGGDCAGVVGAVLGVHGPALLAPVASFLGPWRPAGPGRLRRLVGARSRRGLRADQPAARGRAGAAGLVVALPADEPSLGLAAVSPH